MKKLIVFFVMLMGLSLQVMASCQCEDQDGDGRYGIVHYSRYGGSRVIAPNLGPLRRCERMMSRHAACHEERRTSCSCEDWDGDGRFGVVLNGPNGSEVLEPNIGPSRRCLRVMRRIPRCQ